MNDTRLGIGAIVRVVESDSPNVLVGTIGKVVGTCKKVNPVNMDDGYRLFVRLEGSGIQKFEEHMLEAAPVVDNIES